MPHIELVANQTSAPAPGWAYIPESTYIDPSKAAINPSGARARHKSAAALAAQGSSDISARQQTAIQRRLAELDRDAPTKEVVLSRERAGGAGGKTQATRRILGSQKTWRNWLDDEEAMLVQGGREREQVVRPVAGVAALAQGEKKGKKRGSLAAGGGGSASTSVPATPAPETSAAAEKTKSEDVEMRDAKTSAEDDPLLRVSTLGSISQQQLDVLLSAPPLSYNAARVAPPDANAPPSRHFCELCGYWGRVRCKKCGSRVCGLDCKAMHDSECSRRFA